MAHVCKKGSRRQCYQILEELVCRKTVFPKDVIFFSFPKEFKVYFLEVSAMEGFSDLTDSSDIVQHFEE